MKDNKKAGLQALLVTFLWSTSWVLIKIGLGSLPALTFAGFRYVLAFLLLLPWALLPKTRTAIRNLTKKDALELVLLGLVYFTITQGAQFLTLVYLPANALSLMLTLSSVAIALLGVMFLAERLAGWQWLGILVAVAGALIYFGRFSGGSPLGLILGAICVLANSIGAIQGRAINRRLRHSPLLVTVVSMGVGSMALLTLGLLTEPFPRIGLMDALIILWLAAVNTALAFVIWNHTLRTLSAAQSGLINNTMLIQIAVLAWIFLGERINFQQGLGLLVAAAGTLLVQRQRKQKPLLAVEESAS